MELMTTAEVGSMSRTPVETLRYWRWRGEGPRSFKVGRRVMYDRGEVERWLDECQRSSTSGRPAA